MTRGFETEACVCAGDDGSFGGRRCGERLEGWQRGVAIDDALAESFENY